MADGAATVSPLVTVLVQRLDERWTGTLLVHREGEAALAAVRCESGLVVGAHVRGGTGTLIEQVTALCTLEDARIVEIEGADLVGEGPEVVLAAVDPVRLVAAAIRGAIRQAVVDRALAAIGQDLLRLHPRADLERYGLDRAELLTVAALEPVPLDLAELRDRSPLSEPRLARLLCALLATRAVTVVPAWKRIASGEIVHAPPMAAAGAALPDEEPTAVVPLEALARERAARAALHPARRANSTFLQYLPEPMSRARVARPGSSERPAVPYSVRHPRSGVEVAHSTLPPAGASRFSERPARNEADVLFTRAETLLANGNARAAVFEAQRAMKLASPRPEQRALYAWLLYERARGSESVQPHVWSHLAEALEQGPDCAAVHYYQGALLARVGRIEQALAHLERALQLDPTHAQAAGELRRCKQQQRSLP